MAEASPILSEQQNLAADNISNRTMRILTGAAGTGKSAVIAAVQNRLGDALCVVAPTHTAAANLQDAGIPRVYQVASLTHSSKNSLANQLVMRGVTHVIVDEASMVTRMQKNIIDDLCKQAGIHVTYVGDPNQLPPVDKLLSVFDQNWFVSAAPDLTLRKVYRQKAGVVPRLVRDAFVDPNATHICMTNETRNEINIACHETLFGDKAYADKDKTILNPQPGQMLIANFTSNPYKTNTGQTKVTYRNNALYKIESVARSRFHFTIKFVNIVKSIKISKKEFLVDALGRKGDRSFDFAYAITCHSAQGKGFDHVFVHIECSLLDKGDENQWDYALPDIMIDNWLYTAMTRGKKSITVVDPTGAVAREGLSLNIDPDERAKPKAIVTQDPTKTVPVFEPIEPVAVIEPAYESFPTDESLNHDRVGDKLAELDDDVFLNTFFSSGTPTPRQPSADEIRIKEEQDKKDDDFISTFCPDPFAVRKAMLARRALEAA